MSAEAWKYKEFFNLEARKFHFLKYKIFFHCGFFHFSCSESYLKYKRNIGLRSSISENRRKFRSIKVLNIPFLKYKKSSVSSKLEKLFLRKHKKIFRVGFFLRKKIRSFFEEKFWGLREKSIRNFLILGLDSSPSRNIRKTFWRKYKKFFRRKF